MNKLHLPQEDLTLPIILPPSSAPRPVRWLNHAMRLFPETGQMVNQFRQKGLFGHGPEWPEWCFLPPACFGIIVEDALGATASEKSIAIDMGVLGALAAWRYTQGIYKFSPDFMEELAKTPTTGKMPAERFQHLPEWCVYIDTPNMKWFGEGLHGFWAVLSWNHESHVETLLVLLDRESRLETCLVDVGPWSIEEGVQKVLGYTKTTCFVLGEPDFSASADPVKLAAALSPLVSIVLYLCSDSPAIEHERIPGLRPAYPCARKTRHGWKLFPPVHPTVWEVGKRTGALLRGE